MPSTVHSILPTTSSPTRNLESILITRRGAYRLRVVVDEEREGHDPLRPDIGKYPFILRFILTRFGPESISQVLQYCDTN